MNNYFNFKQDTLLDNYSYMNNQNKIVNKEWKENKLYDPYQGFIRGNMYKSLYNPYKLKQPYEIKPMNEQAELLTYIDALCFACIDINLYLDVYPNDREMISLYDEYNKQKEEIMNQYQKKFGPLVLSSDSLNSYPWGWNDKPWPWENN